MSQREHKNLLLICAAGITTGLLVRSIEKIAEEQKIPIHVFSAPSIVAQQIIKDDTIDAILIGPQISHEVKRLEELLNHEKIPYRLIEEDSYRLLDGKSILEQGMRMIENNLIFLT